MASEDDVLKMLWQAQEEEAPPMAIEEIRRRSDRLGSLISRRNWTEYVAGFVVMLAFGGFALIAPNAVLKLGAVLTVLGTALVLWLMWRRGSAGKTPADAAAADLLDFHRRELARQRDLLAWAWLWYLGPLVPGMVLFFWGSAIGRPVTPALWASMALGIVMFVAIAVANLWAARRIQKEIDGLG